MDHINIPTFALLRYGTVIVRLKMEKMFSSCHRAQVLRTRVPGLVHRVSSCEQCTRTRIVSKYSDCDSAIIGKCRPYRTRAAKSRYVNVCAAVCLLLLVGGLTPQSSAAPHRTRNMDRSKRASDQENETWSNPCDYNKSVINTLSLKYEPGLAEKVAMQARHTISKAKAYELDVAHLHTYTDFSKLLKEWQNTTWLRNKNNHPWWKEIIMPDNKEIGNKAEESDLIKTLDNIKEALPLISKALKALGAALSVISKALNPATDGALQIQMQNTSDDVRHVLCLTSDLMRARGVQMLPHYDSEIPNYNQTTEEKKVVDAFLIYRDTINFLEYIDALFIMMSERKLEEEA